MDKVARHVQEIDAAEKRVYESVLGQVLQADQQVIVQVITPGASPDATTGGQHLADQLSDYCNVYDGMSQTEVAELG
jgi:hypothetical protein